MTSALFSPIRLAELELPNRIVVSPMCQYSADDGVASGWHITHLGMLANSGAALVVLEATGTERRGRITHGCLGLYSDDCEAAVARVNERLSRLGDPRRCNAMRVRRILRRGFRQIHTPKKSALFSHACRHYPD